MFVVLMVPLDQRECSCGQGHAVCAPNHTSFAINDLHQVTAWTMAGGYLLFAVIFAYAASVNHGVILMYVTLLFVAYALSALTRHGHFWLTQMVFLSRQQQSSVLREVWLQHD